jgi:hypothetical protein
MNHLVYARSKMAGSGKDGSPPATQAGTGHFTEFRQDEPGRFPTPVRQLSVTQGKRQTERPDGIEAKDLPV